MYLWVHQQNNFLLLSKNISFKVLVKSSTIRFMFIILLRRACLPMLHVRQWDLVRRVSTLQLQIGFIIPCKLCLTLSSRKLLKSTHSLVMNLILLCFSQLKTTFRGYSENVRILFSKTLKIPAFKTNFLQDYVLFWKRCFFHGFSWCKKRVSKELVWKDTGEIHFLKFAKFCVKRDWEIRSIIVSSL